MHLSVIVITKVFEHRLVLRSVPSLKNENWSKIVGGERF